MCNEVPHDILYSHDLQIIGPESREKFYQAKPKGKYMIKVTKDNKLYRYRIFYFIG